MLSKMMMWSFIIASIIGVGCSSRSYPAYPLREADRLIMLHNGDKVIKKDTIIPIEVDSVVITLDRYIWLLYSDNK